MKNFRVIDLRRTDAFPNLDYRFASVREEKDKVVLERDFLGEDPLHYYVCGREGELIVASNICDIKENLEKKGRTFSWERVRAVSNNKRVVFDDPAFVRAEPYQEELGLTLQEMPLDTSFDYSDFSQVGRRIRGLLEKSVKQRLQTIKDGRIGLLLSGGLDSMSVAYILSQQIGNKELVAFTLKTSDKDKDIVKSREIAPRCGIRLVEIGVYPVEPQKEEVDVFVGDQHVDRLSLEKVVDESLRISGNPKHDNLHCAINMYLAGKAIQKYGIRTVFCGEAVNELVHDYDWDPAFLGYGTHDKSDFRFREALTFGVKEGDLQLGRGGLPKHAIARMGKMFAHYGLRLEAPYFDAEIAKILTHVPHIPNPKNVKEHLMMHVLNGAGLDDLIAGSSKEKFQHGSGTSNYSKHMINRHL